MEANKVRGSYFTSGFEQQNNIIAAFTQVLEQKMFGDFDGIVCRGVSGLLVSSILANRFNLKLFVARKGGESSHDGESAGVGSLTINKFIIVDDFVETGDTILECLKSVNRIKESYSYASVHDEEGIAYEDRSKMEYVGCFLYCGFGCPKTRLSWFTDTTKIEQCCNGKKFVCWNSNSKELVEYQY